jgi:hypothetical protein
MRLAASTDEKIATADPLAIAPLEAVNMKTILYTG